MPISRSSLWKICLAQMAALSLTAGANAALAAEDLNRVFGLPLWQDASLWDDGDSAVARRLGWPEESRTSSQTSYRKYGSDGDRVMGARAYSLALFGQTGRPAQLSLVFANKGDFGALSDVNRDLETAVGQAKTDLRKQQHIRPDASNNHVCLIIGYNGETEELAISDSWGPEFRERWITVEEAEAISQSSLKVITW